MRLDLLESSLSEDDFDDSEDSLPDESWLLRRLEGLFSFSARCPGLGTICMGDAG